MKRPNSARRSALMRERARSLLRAVRCAALTPVTRRVKSTPTARQMPRATRRAPASGQPSSRARATAGRSLPDGGALVLQPLSVLSLGSRARPRARLDKDCSAGSKCASRKCTAPEEQRRLRVSRRDGPFFAKRSGALRALRSRPGRARSTTATRDFGLASESSVHRRPRAAHRTARAGVDGSLSPAALPLDTRLQTAPRARSSADGATPPS